MVFVPATPRSELKKTFERIVNESKIGIKVVEKSGRSIKNIIQKSDPFSKDKCRDSEQCMVCSSEQRGGGRCRQVGVSYIIKCSKCNFIYHGETSRNAYTRGQEHAKALNNKREDSVLYRHTKQQHPNDSNPHYTMNITGIHKSALSRQIFEAVKISNTPSGILMNNKSEFGHNKLWKISMTDSATSAFISQNN